MKLIFSENGWDDYLYWQKNDKKLLKRINDLIKDIKRNKYEGKGKPESLRHQLAGYWSRRIDSGHRCIYKIENDSIIIIQLRYHY
jgi:toxin YoeB